ncbi:MarR family transcriptional regulator [Amycolatopsis acidiphila]|uniref:MarR family winged helix-turn-helix transcriptional regulator n=1 Tax=Amycolatopsis acidiphila TaxID=715473 RepID=UPI001E29E106|nr:MarR family transcriptional regulator [Amycolatopsis acidiphila]UIJ57642.1 MarR family transcriptional regulator [Amycolatopsis acidiphila]
MSEEDALQLVVSLHRLLRSLRRASANTHISPTQLIVIAQLMEHGPLRVGELADRVPCSQPTATTCVAGLEAGGYVRREPDPTDGRATKVTVTDAGRQVLLSMAHSEAATLTERLDVLPAEEVALVLAATPVLRALTDLPQSRTPITP